MLKAGRVEPSPHVMTAQVRAEAATGRCRRPKNCTGTDMGHLLGKMSELRSTQEAFWQIERLSSTNSFTAPDAGRFFRVMDAFAPALSATPPTYARSHSLIEGLRSIKTFIMLKTGLIQSSF